MHDSLLLSRTTAVVCPRCEFTFSVEQGFAKQALDSIASQSALGIAELKAQERSLAERQVQELLSAQEHNTRHATEHYKRELARQAQEHAAALKEAKISVDAALQTRLQALQGKLAQQQNELQTMQEREQAITAREQAIKREVQEAASRATAELVAGERSAFEQRLREKEAQVAELRAAEISLRNDKARIEDRAAALELEVARQLDAGRSEIEARTRAQEQERAALREAEYHKTIADMRVKLNEAQLKAEQGSQQLQGEVLELAMEEGLRRAFPPDQIEEVKKGFRGGDVIQRVATRSGQIAGNLLWEAKRAKEFSPQWIAKLKDDMRQCGAEVGVLVTMPTAVPKEWKHTQTFGLHEGVWVTTWSAALHLGEVLRCGVLDCHKQRLISAGKGEKLEAVYDYLTSPHFAQKLRAVYDTFEKMREDLEAEKHQSLQRWARRDKQLQSGLNCLLGIGGEIQGLAQQELPELELTPLKLALP
jgi:hypothetical protein